MKLKYALCSCGTRVSLDRAKVKSGKAVGEHPMQAHLRSVWHRIALECRRRRKMGMSYAEIARQSSVKVSRHLVWYHMEKE